MKKIKLSVGILTFMGLAALNFTQSESCLVSESHAANTCCNDTITSSGDSSSSSSTSTDVSSSDYSASESSSTVFYYDIVERACSYTKMKEVIIKVKDENGNIIERKEMIPVTFYGYYEVCVRTAGGRYKSCEEAHCNTKCH